MIAKQQLLPGALANWLQKSIISFTLGGMYMYPTIETTLRLTIYFALLMWLTI